MDVSFSADQLRRVLGSAEGKQLLALLAADGGGRLRQAAEAVKAGGSICGSRGRRAIIW